MRRREIIGLLGAAAAWPLAARAQQPAMPVVGFLSTVDPRRAAFRAFHEGLAERGYVEGRNLTIDYRWAAEGNNERLPALAADLVRLQVAVIVSSGGIATALAAKAATQTIPVVFTIGVDPIAAGLVANLGRPGGNLTGATLLASDLVAKRFEMLRELLPGSDTFALLSNPASPFIAETERREAQVAAGILGVKLLPLNANSEREIEAAFATIIEQRVGGLVVSSDPALTNRATQIVTLAARYAVPAIYFWRDYTAVGGLISYGPDRAEAYRIAGAYTGRILKGEKPAGLPVQQVTKVELSINLKTAKALGLTVPLSLRGRADEVIE